MPNKKMNIAIYQIFISKHKAKTQYRNIPNVKNNTYGVSDVKWLIYLRETQPYVIWNVIDLISYKI